MDQNLNAPQHSNIRINAHGDAESLLEFTGLRDSESIPTQLTSGTVEVVMPLLVLTASPSFQEHWSDGASVMLQTNVDNLEFTTAETKHHLMLSFQCDNHRPLDELVAEIYTKAYHFAHQQGFKHVIRVWNYLDRINGYERAEERYQTFCVARHQVLESIQQLQHPNPAATAIGGHFGFNTFVFLFSQQAGQVVENKRQVSAWQYPRQYAPRQPRFSRAMQCGNVLLCSGTASVVGHETIHLNDLTAQFDECLTNIQALLHESSLEMPLNQGVYRFYLRDKSLVNQVVNKIKALQINDFLVLEGDVCRENLLIECEAVFQSV